MILPTAHIRRFGSSLAKHRHLILTALLLLSACSDTLPDTGPGGPGSTPGDTGSDGPGSISGKLIFPGNVEGAVLGSPDGFVSNIMSDDTPSFVPGEVVVKFRSGVQLQSLQTLSVQGMTLQRAQSAGLPRTALYKAGSLDEQGTLELVADLSARPDVVYAEPNYIKTIQKTPNDPLYPYQWHYEAMNLPAAWDIEDGTSNRVTVAVIDTGSLPHPDLQGVFVGGHDFVSDPDNGGDGDGYDNDPTDLGQASSYHGAHVAGTVAASTNNGSGVAGVSWGAKVLPIRALGVTGSGTNVDVANAVLWAAGEFVADAPLNTNPAQVINLSLGGQAPCSQLEQDAYDAARAKGIVVVVAAGNENTDAAFSSPANCKGVVVVGATGPRNARAPYSNHGLNIDVMAPGGDSSQTFTLGGRAVPTEVFSTIKDDSTGLFNYGFYSGTSMAAPHIAGLVALMLAQEPELDPDTILARLRASAVPLSAAECSRPSGEACGAGLVNAAVALGETSPLPPILDTTRIDTYVVALYCLAACADFDVRRSGSTSLSAEGLEVPYQIGDLTVGTYALVAWQDLNQNAGIDDGEPVGIYPANPTLRAGQALQGADIDLEPFTPQAQTTAAEKKRFRNVVQQIIQGSVR